MTKITALGRLTASEDRKLRGILLPYGVPGLTNLGRVTADKGSIDVPKALDALHASLDHLDDRDDVAQYVSLEETDEGLLAEWNVPKTHGGDKLLAEYRAGIRTGVSVEIEPVQIKDGKIVAGTLIGNAFPIEPAFPTARLVAEKAPDVDLEDDDEDPEPCDRDGCDVVGTHTHAPAPDDDEVDDEDDAGSGDTTDTTTPEGTTMTAATARRRKAVAPSDLLTASSATKRKELVTTTADFFRLLAAAQGDRRLMAALADVTPTEIGDMDVPQWVGELWSGVGYTRRIVPLLNHADLTEMTIEGWRWVTRPEMGKYAGNKTPIPSNELDTEPVSQAAERLAGGHDIDRKYVDFRNTGFFQSYYAAMSESYSKLTDLLATRDLKAGASTVALGAVPSGIDAGWAAIVDLALAVVDVGSPSYALVEKSVYRSMILTPKDQVLEYLTASLGLEEGGLAGFRIIPVAATPQTGVDYPGLDTGEIIVGAKQAATFHELGGGAPIRVEALNVANGGVDAGVFGYAGTVIHDDRAVVKADLTADV